MRGAVIDAVHILKRDLKRKMRSFLKFLKLKRAVKFQDAAPELCRI